MNGSAIIARLLREQMAYAKTHDGHLPDKMYVTPEEDRAIRGYFGARAMILIPDVVCVDVIPLHVAGVPVVVAPGFA